MAHFKKILNPKASIAEITELKRKGKIEQAKLLLEKRINEFPNNIFFINGLIELNVDTRFDRCVGLLNKAVKLGVADTITYSLMLDKFIEKKDILNIEYYFRKCVANGKEDTIICNNMLNFYFKTGSLKQGEFIFEKLINNEKANEITYAIMLNHLYISEKYLEGLKLISKTPEKFKEYILLKIHEIEFNRKLKNYDLCFNLISQCLEIPDLKYDFTVNLETIKAYCLKDTGEKEKAIELFRQLFKNNGEDSASYIRIICGLVFCEGVRPYEYILFNNILRDAEKENKGNYLDVIDAIKILRNSFY